MTGRYGLFKIQSQYMYFHGEIETLQSQQLVDVEI